MSAPTKSTATVTPLSGKNGYFGVGTVAYPLSNWTFTGEISELDVSDTSGQGFEQAIAGLKKGSGSFDFYFDSSLVPYLYVTEGMMLSDLYLQTGSGGTGVHLPLALVTSVQTSVDLTDSVKMSVNFRNNGTYSYETT